MTHIQFYFDPSCPWCWVTSRWLTEVAAHRDVTIDWRPFSLALKNNELSGTDTTGHQAAHTASHEVIRIIEAIHAKAGVSRGDLYTAFGKANFVDKSAHNENYLKDVLTGLELSHDYLGAAKTETYDAGIQKHLDEAIAIVGADVGVPLIIFVNDKNQKQGYFGPVLQALPELEEGLRLWDGLVLLGNSPHFFELKRSRTGGVQPETTERLFENNSYSLPPLEQEKTQ